MNILTTLNKYNKERKLKRDKLKKRFIGRENMIFNLQMLSYTATFILSISFIFFLIFGPLKIIGEVLYYEGADDNVTSSVVGYCKYYDNDEEKIMCVNKFVNDNWKYLVTNKVLSPDEVILNGGDCKSWSNFYMITLRQLNVSVTQNFDSVKTHTFVIADTDDGYCVIDQRSVVCQSLNKQIDCDDVEGNCVSFS